METLDIRSNRLPWLAKLELTPTRQNPLRKVLSSLKRESESTDVEIKVPEGCRVSDYKVFAILREVLQPKVVNNLDTVFKAADRIIEVFRNYPPYEIRSLNQLFFDIAENIPYNHPSHVRLASLVWAIGRSEKRVTLARSKSENPDMFYQYLWEEIADNHPIAGEEADNAMLYVNYQAFIAHLNALGTWYPGVKDVREPFFCAFDDNHDDESIAIQEAWVMGAAQWILWYGQSLFRYLLWPSDAHPSFNEELTSEKSRQEARNSLGVTMRMWQGWKEGFKKSAAKEAFGDECKRVLNKAVRIMEALEDGMLV